MALILVGLLIFVVITAMILMKEDKWECENCAELKQQKCIERREREMWADVKMPEYREL